jgi:DNA helicase-2/ATP-dependent DNA helicase PcrA
VQYTPQQKKAIECIDQNLQIIACAGSGKTQVISARIVNILKTKKSQGISPANIVAFTFTDKAAGELKDRIHRLCKEELGSDLGLAEMFVGTIHAYCLNLLQAPPLYKFLKYTVLTDVQQRLLIDRNSTKSGLTQVPLLSGGKLERWKDSRLYQQLLGIYGEGNVNLNKVPAEVKSAVQQYYELLDAKKYLDYTMIIAQAVAEIENNTALREKVSTQLKYLVVDEYQDVNPLQEMLIRQLHDLGANLCVVGDDDQTIYQWRGSDVSNIIDFTTRYPKVKQVPLNDNYRSSSGIVIAARQVIENNNPGRLAKQMESTDAQPYHRGDVLAVTFDDPNQEAAWIAKKIKALHSTSYKDKKDSQPRGLTYADFAILLRSVRNDAGPILAALAAEEIPFIVGGMNGLFDTAEIQAMRAVFFFLADFAPKGEQPIKKTQVEKILAEGGLGLTTKQVTAGIKFLENTKAKIGNEMDAELYLQRVYLDFLEVIGLKEEDITKADGAGRGEIVYFNLGKFSQVISDFEHINFNTNPKDLYPAVAAFLHYQAPDYYPEGWENTASAKPDAVQIMTVHQAKGMQWPTVFVPCLRQNRFPSRRQGGRSVWHIIPDSIVRNAERYKGTVEDERRLFYVALTRAEKFLFGSWAPIADNRQQRNVSDFYRELTDSEFVLTKEAKAALSPRIASKPRKENIVQALTFSELKYYFECPYLFKLRFLYGFDTPISRALGYGKSLHDALAEIHAESLKGRIPTKTDVPRLVEDHLHLPFANRPVEDNLKRAAHKALTGYIQSHGQNLSKLEHVEKVIELKLAEGIVVSGRIDLIRKTDTNEIVIVDFKSDERAQTEDLSQKQLHIYAVGYEQLSGKRADLIEVHNLDKGGAKREVVDEALMKSTVASVIEAGRKLRENHLPRLPTWCEKCASCDMVEVCRQREASRPKSAA